MKNKVKKNLAKKGKEVPKTAGCGEGCASCASKGICGGHLSGSGTVSEMSALKKDADKTNEQEGV